MNMHSNKVHCKAQGHTCRRKGSIKKFSKDNWENKPRNTTMRSAFAHLDFDYIQIPICSLSEIEDISSLWLGASGYRISPKNKMAVSATRSKRERRSYDVLHNLNLADILFPERKKKKRSVLKHLRIYEAERLVASQEGSELRNPGFNLPSAYSSEVQTN